MVMRIGVSRRKTRHALMKPIRNKGKISLTKFFQNLEIGDKVQLCAESAYQKGMYNPRFHGKHGIVKAKKGACYFVEINDLGKFKNVLCHPVHLKRV